MATKSNILSLIEDGDTRAKARAALEELIEEAREAGHNETGHRQRKEIDQLKADLAKAQETVTAAQTAHAVEVQALKAQSPGPDVAAEVKALKDRLALKETAFAKLTAHLETGRTAKLHAAVAEAANLSDPDVVAPWLVSTLGLAPGPDGKLTPEHLTALKTWAADPVNKGRVKPPAEQPPAAQEHPAPPQTQIPRPLPQTGPVVLPGAKLTAAARSYIARTAGAERAAALAAYGATETDLAPPPQP